MRYKRVVGVGILVMFILTIGCAGMFGEGSTIDKFMNLSPKGKVTVAIKMYNKVFDDASMVMTNPISTVAQKQVAMEKLRILVKYQETIKMYNSFIVQGTIPPLEDEQKLIEFVEKLIEKGVELL